MGDSIMAQHSQWPFPDEPVGDEKPPENRSAYDKTENAVTLVVGTSKLYEHGKLRLIPMPTPDPKDPLNLPNWRKWVAIGAISFIGSLALSAEIIISGLLPVFLLEYSGVNPRILNNVDFKSQSGGSTFSIDLLSALPPGVTPAPLGKVALLATVPLLATGIASYLLVPLSIAVGRRPVLLFAAACAWGGALWAGLSNNLEQHIVARGVQGLGAGAAEAVIPLIVQDMVFIHQRNKAMATVVASQGVVLVALGVASPYIAVNYTWRWIYYITSGAGFVAWLLLVCFLPETRWTRSKRELNGQRIWPLRPDQDRPDLDYERYGVPTIWTRIGIFHYGFEFKNAAKAIFDTLRTMIFPAVVWAVVTNSILLICSHAVAQITVFALLAQGWQFQYIGVSVAPFLPASILVYVFGGPVADMLSNAVTRWSGGKRDPEHHLVNVIFPFMAGVGGCFLFGYAGEKNLHWAILLAGAFLIVFGFLALISILNVFVVESYPMWAGPVLTNVSSLRIIVAFFIVSKTPTWITERGALAIFALYAEVMIVLSLGIPGLYFFGNKMRQWTAGKVHGVRIEKRAMDDSRSV